MLCKNCGVEIEENSKFCGNCGTKVEITNEEVSNIEDVFVAETDKNIGFEIKNPATKNTIEPRVETVSVDLEKTLNLGTIPALNTQLLKDAKSETMSVDLEKTLNLGTFQSLEKQRKELENSNNEINQNSMSYQNNNVQLNQDVMNNQNMFNNNSSNNTRPNNNQNNKKGNKLPIIIGGIALGVIAIIVVILAVTRSSNSTVKVLEKAMNNLMINSENGITIDGKIDIKAKTGESFNLSTTIKAEKKQNNIDMQITLNKSLFFDEMNVYANVNENNATLYVNSTTLDMLGTTYSEVPMWLYSTVSLAELLEGEEIDLTNSNKTLNFDVIDKNHFVFVDSEGDIDHYKFIIDQELINTLKTKVKEEELREELETIEPIEKPIELDFYINKSNELTKIVLDLAQHLEEETMESITISIEFSGMNNTKVDIPKQAKDSKIDIDSYMETYYSLGFDESYDLEYEEDYSVDFNTDVNSFGF